MWKKGRGENQLWFLCKIVPHFIIESPNNSAHFLFLKFCGEGGRKIDILTRNVHFEVSIFSAVRPPQKLSPFALCREMALAYWADINQVWDISPHPPGVTNFLPVWRVYPTSVSVLARDRPFGGPPFLGAQHIHFFVVSRQQFRRLICETGHTHGKDIYILFHY